MSLLPQTCCCCCCCCRWHSALGRSCWRSCRMLATAVLKLSRGA